MARTKTIEPAPSLAPSLPFRTGYETDYDSSVHGIDCSQDGMTHQSFKDECDINSILNSWNKTGELGHVNTYEGSYLDLTHVHDYQKSLELVMNAENAFADLDAKIRAKFDNDPAKLLAFIHSPNTTREMLENYGLADKVETAPIPPAEPHQLPT